MGSEESGASAGSNSGAIGAPRGALCRVADIPDGGAIGAHVPSSTGGFDLILLRLGERVFAYHNECPHAGRNLDYAPGQFLVSDARIVCAVHGATFAVQSLWSDNFNGGSGGGGCVVYYASATDQH